MEINNCASSPCLNGGTCVNVVNDFVCECPPDFQGDLCNAEINNCTSSPCLNGGTCVDGIDNFTCTCLPDFGGNLCQKGKKEKFILYIFFINCRTYFAVCLIRFICSRINIEVEKIVIVKPYTFF